MTQTDVRIDDCQLPLERDCTRLGACRHTGAASKALVGAHDGVCDLPGDLFRLVFRNYRLRAHDLVDLLRDAAPRAPILAFRDRGPAPRTVSDGGGLIAGAAPQMDRHQGAGHRAEGKCGYECDHRVT